METLRVKDVMTRKVITASMDSSVKKVASLMTKHKIGGVIIVNREGKPVGIITERDIVEKVVSKGRSSARTKAKEIMSSPLHTIEPNKTLLEAMKSMRNFGIRRLPVMEKGKLKGIVTSRDILRVAPSLIEVLMETVSVAPTLSPSSTIAGYCEICGEWSDSLREYKGMYVCPRCLEEAGEELETA